jgi:ABC-type uncharacterized transport system ATPase component
LKEPDERLFVGDEPEIFKRVAGNKTKYIKNLKIGKTQTSTIQEDWFVNIDIDLSNQLVAVIGNKGNGKSALLDSIGLVGNAQNCKVQNLTFLNKFREDAKAKNFTAKITWEDETSNERNLGDDIDVEQVNRVKYIPQHYFETLCNDNGYEFENELKNVIFSHITDDKRAGKTSLDNLLNYKTSQKRDEIDLLIEALKTTNQNIVDVTNLCSQENVKLLKSNLEIKENELKAQQKNKPVEIKAPTVTEDAQKQFTDKIEKLTKKKDELETLIKKSIAEKTEISKKRDALEKIIGELQTTELRFKIGRAHV